MLFQSIRYELVAEHLAELRRTSENARRIAHRANDRRNRQTISKPARSAGTHQSTGSCTRMRAPAPDELSTAT
jgi:hypothetical protein